MTTGLTSAEAARRLAADGPNAITAARRVTSWTLLRRQLSGVMLWVLVGACVLSALLGDAADAAGVAAILVLNVVVGFFQEHRAERALDALRGLTAPRARVRRDGDARVIAATEVVRGDLLLLEEGDLCAADARLAQAHELAANEAILTGESLPVDKEVGAPVFMGTAVARGGGVAEVTATGMATALGRIAGLLESAEEGATPLARGLERVGKELVLAAVVIVAAVAGLGLARGGALGDVLLTAVSLAVAAVPEGLVAIVTVALAIGVQRMAARHVLVRRLHAVETLGAATVICTDKTGTLTAGAMRVREIRGEAGAVLDAAAACVDAEVNQAGAVGDPTEVALVLAAAERGIRRDAIERERPRVEVRPFSSARRRMSILRADGVRYVKGAVEAVVPACVEGADGALDEAAVLAARGLRVLAVAVGRGPEDAGLRLVGLVGLADPPRPEAAAAVARARRAGVRTVMLTGDHPTTARAIAAELGIDEVHARVTAEEKLRLVRDLKAHGEVVAMTGDGVNDAPALREAHVGVAMGRTAAEVTREASAVILTDDNYASIVAAIEEGRGTFLNIRKTLVWMLGGNSAELAIMLVAGLLGLPLPLVPLQLLWINLVTDGLPALALVADPAPADAMARPPRRPSEPILGRRQWGRVATIGAIEATLALAAYALTLDAHGLLAARTMAFSVVVYTQLFRSFAARSTTRIFWEVGAFTNLRLLGVVVASVLLQVVLQATALRGLFELAPFDPGLAGVALALGLVPVTLIELGKLARRLVRWPPRDTTMGMSGSR